MPNYDEELERAEERKGKESFFSFFRGVKPGWWIAGAFFILVFFQWYNSQAKKVTSPWMAIGIVVAALIAIAMGQGSKDSAWITRDEAEAEIYKKIKREQGEIYSRLPEGDIVISSLGGTDYYKETWFIPWFIIDKVSDQRIWGIARVDCYGKGYLGSYLLSDGEVPTGKEAGYMYRPTEALKFPNKEE